MTDRHLLCFGFGYCARALARVLRNDPAYTVTGTCRRQTSREALYADGFEALPFARNHPTDDAVKALQTATDLILSIPPDGRGDPVFDLLQHAIARAPRLRWIGYLSTTGVYGDRNGDWVDENSALQPTGKRGRRRVRAERAWQSLCQRHQIGYAGFRLAGIYGPGRNAFTTIRSGRARRLVKPGQVFSRIHLHDITRVLENAVRKRATGPFNLCDHEAAPPQEVIRHACEMLGTAPPPEIALADAELSDMARSFYRDNKRVSNARMTDVLRVKLAYPTYREGLAALFADLD